MGKDTTPESKKPIVKSEGVNLSEMFLTKYCERAFLKLWAYPNPYKEPGVELCDVLAVFEEHVFIFSIKDISFSADKTTEVAWERWKNKAIDKSINQIQGAEKWIRKNPEKIFLDAQCKENFPLPIDPKNCKIHRIVVAFGAEEACKNNSPKNINGSLGISYSDLENPKEQSESIGPFFLKLPRDEVVHVLDSYNLEIILGELDTVSDLLSYFEAKEEAIKKYRVLICSGEEELLAEYFCNFDKKTQKHYIGTKNKEANIFMIGDGYWNKFIESTPYKIRKQKNEVSYLWDKLLQKVLQYKLDGELTGNADAFKNRSASIEMAKEPRFSRRALSQALLKSIDDFRIRMGKARRILMLHSSFYPDRMYVFFHMRLFPNMDYEKEYRPSKRILLNIACGVVKNKYPNLKKVIGITVDIPEFSQHISEDFILLDCKNWTKEDAENFRIDNKETRLNAFEDDQLEVQEGIIYDFPPE